MFPPGCVYRLKWSSYSVPLVLPTSIVIASQSSSSSCTACLSLAPPTSNRVGVGSGNAYTDRRIHSWLDQMKQLKRCPTRKLLVFALNGDGSTYSGGPRAASCGMSLSTIPLLIGSGLFLCVVLLNIPRETGKKECIGLEKIIETLIKRNACSTNPHRICIHSVCTKETDCGC